MLSDEIVPIDRARAALSRGDTDTALRTLDEYDREFSQGTLAPEAAVLRIEALTGAGRSGEARAAARAFLAAHPTSPLASRVRKVLGAIDAGEP
jgi:outer membrane protein assembly factor BamD (BamD/ComL family)